MRKSRALACWLAAVMLIGITAIGPVTVSGADVLKEEYAYFLNTAADSAYVSMGAKIEGKYCSFIDGQALGITDAQDPLYNESVNLDGLDARKQYNANTAYFKVEKEFYAPEEHTFLISIVFYDFGPSEGTFQLEYHSTDGGLKQVRLVKPGTNPGWAVKTVCADDIDFGKTYDNGATIRIVNGAFNAFRKLEIVNVSRAVKEKKAPDITCLGNEVRTDVQNLEIVKKDDVIFRNQNISKPCTVYDMLRLKNILAGNTAEISEAGVQKTVTQGELLQNFMQLLGLEKSKKENESWTECAARLKLTGASAFFLFDDAPAINYHLISLIHTALSYKMENGETILMQLIQNGFYDGIDFSTIKSELFLSVYYTIPRKNPYIVITDNTTGRTYKYVNFFGTELRCPYLTEQTWTLDGKSFVCGTAQGYMYLYNTETQMMTYLDKTPPNTAALAACVASNGWIYYPKNEGVYSLWRIHPDTLQKEKLYDFPAGVTFFMLNITNDGKYASFEISDNNYVYERPKGTYPVVRLNLETKEMEWRYYSFSYSNIVDHYQINPGYPNLIMFSHETDTSKWQYADIYDRSNIMDLDTGEVKTYAQGRMENGRPVQLVTHEIWSYDGEHMWFCSWAADYKRDSGGVPAVVRIDKDSTHRQYYTSSVPWGFNHSSAPSGDGKFIAAEEQFLVLIHTETHQMFPIANMRALCGMRGHPYHPHPRMAMNDYLVLWGHMYRGVLGVAWMDFTDIAENEVKKGGRFPLGSSAQRVSYEDLECETTETVKAGKSCISVSPGKSLFVDINPEVIDVTDGAVKITFDYYDNGRDSLVLTYTKGVKEANDVWKMFNAEKKVSRKNSNQWKHAEIVIDSGNFESIGKFDTDFKISGTGQAFIANVKVEAVK